MRTSPIDYLRFTRWYLDPERREWNLKFKAKGERNGKTEEKETGRVAMGTEDLTKTEKPEGSRFDSRLQHVRFFSVSISAKALFPTPFPLPFPSILRFNLHIARSVSSDISIWMGGVCIPSWYPNFNGNHFGLPPSEIHRMTGLGGKMAWTMTYSHRPHPLRH